MSGGWFDARDYNKCVTILWACINDLLMAYRESTIAFGDDWDIPESCNGVPNILDEIKWELD
ncbi:MAG: glycoside hydrolase family 9 protein [Flavobacteriales bacterium]|nr:glycoside hydrolase family 9 protein [Flavobacteriales bacterium]